MSQDELNKRNTESVRQELDRTRNLVYDQKVRLDAQDATIASLMQRIIQVEYAVNIMRARLAGHGPTER